jgi:16S rRNA A1518/A1519 N6-dimethyltransferase RsmA/KsgA/DIM1 with predicted DNA glycosylase/AP lyase activity
VFAPWYEELVAAQPNLRFLREDFLKLDLAELLASAREAGRPICAAGNLPYQITSAILFHLVDAVFPFESLVLMMQREVADRIAAGAGERACGGLSCKVALRYHARIAMRLAPGEFMPPPAVHSAVLVLTPLAQPLYRDEAHRGRLYKLIDGVFRYRRKTVENGPDRIADFARPCECGSRVCDGLMSMRSSDRRHCRWINSWRSRAPSNERADHRRAQRNQDVHSPPQHRRVVQGNGRREPI